MELVGGGSVINNSTSYSLSQKATQQNDTKPL